MSTTTISIASILYNFRGKHRSKGTGSDWKDKFGLALY